MDGELEAVPVHFPLVAWPTVGAIVTEGFRDILEIAYERRYDQYDLCIEKPDTLVPRERVATVAERVAAAGQVLEPLDPESVHRAVDTLVAGGVETLAVCLLHACANPAHEKAVRDIVESRHPGLPVSLSCEVSPEVREFDRLSTTVADACIKPLMEGYLKDLARKNAIHTHHGKNLVGTFHQPKLVLDDVSVLASLPRRELLSGYGEVVKCGLIRDEAEFGWLERNASALLALDTGPLIEAVRLGCETKARIVTSDERDRGDRALVNLGHTFAHAVETEAGHGALPHGEAVAAGLAAAAALSAKLGYCDRSVVDRVRGHLRGTGLPDRIAALATNRAWDPGAILRHMAHDKKTVGGRVHFLLLRGIGAPFVDGSVREKDVLDILESECTSTD